jgi:hypothetical protein
MKKSDLKRLLKPMVKECIKECLYEEGLLSGVVSEVVKGLNGNVIHENVKPPKPKPVQSSILTDPVRNNREVLKEQRKKLMSAIGKDSYGGVNVFEGIKPTSPQRSPEAAASSPLGDMDPGDAGVDISGIMAIGGNKWKALLS